MLCRQNLQFMVVVGIYKVFCLVRLPNQIRTMDWNDTFLNLDHLKASFPDHEVRVITDKPTVESKPPFR